MTLASSLNSKYRYLCLNSYLITDIIIIILIIIIYLFVQLCSLLGTLHVGEMHTICPR